MPSQQCSTGDPLRGPHLAVPLAFGRFEVGHEREDLVRGHQSRRAASSQSQHEGRIAYGLTTEFCRLEPVSLEKGLYLLAKLVADHRHDRNKKIVICLLRQLEKIVNFLFQSNQGDRPWT